jgi:DNA polymerase-3 subunit epsilon
MQLNLTKPIIIFDIEATGVNVGSDRIVEIAMLKVFPGGKEEFQRHLLNPTIVIPDEVIAIHGITNEMVKNEPTFKDIAGNLNAFVGNSDLSGYNSIKYDIPLLVEEFLRAGIEFELKNRRIVDVQNIFHKMEPRTLKAAYKFYCGSELENAHTAEADTRATFAVLKAQIERYNGVEYIEKDGSVTTPVKNDISALNDFSYYNRNADLVGHLIFNKQGKEILNFGKYKGKIVEEVFATEPSYYDWMMKGDFPLSTKKTITAIKLRGFKR